jgi:hypothetical protein
MRMAYAQEREEKWPFDVGFRTNSCVVVAILWSPRNPRRHGTNMNQIEILLDAINNLSPRIPLTVDLWSVKEIAAYLKRSEAVVRERITALPGFPQAIRLPVAGSKGRGQPLWKAKEVIAWTEKHQEKRIA